MDQSRDQADEDVHQDKEPENPKKLAENIAGIGKGPGKDDLGGICSPVPFEEFRGHKDYNNALVNIEELEAEKRDGSRQGPEVVGKGKGRGCDPGRQKAHNNEAQQGEYAEAPRPQENFGLISCDF
jgi:hypothetical protein